MIPKIVHQIYWNRLFEDDFHPIVKEKRDFMITLNPGYKFILYDMDEIEKFIHKKFDTNIVKAFDKLNYNVPKSDLARLLLVYNYGGVYLDMKGLINCKLDQLFKPNDTCIIAVERIGWANNFSQWCFISEPGHPLLKYAIDEIVENVLKCKYPNNLFETCTWAFGKSTEKFHKDFFNEELTVHKTKNRKNVHFENKEISYRICGIEFNDNILYDCEIRDYLYKPKTKHWYYYSTNTRLIREPILVQYLKCLIYNPKYALSLIQKKVKNQILFITICLFLAFRLFFAFQIYKYCTL